MVAKTSNLWGELRGMETPGSFEMRNVTRRELRKREPNFSRQNNASAGTPHELVSCPSPSDITYDVGGGGNFVWARDYHEFHC